MNVNLQFHIDYLNQILTALASLPYSQSSTLIAEIHRQAQPQIDEFNEKMAKEAAEKAIADAADASVVTDVQPKE